MQVLQEIREAIKEQNYRISAHANEEMSEDGLMSSDVEDIILKGKINRKFSHDPRGTRFEITGHTQDGRRAFVVCRFLHSKTLPIITAYI